MSVAYDLTVPSDPASWNADWCADWPGSRSRIANLALVPDPADPGADAPVGRDAHILLFPVAAPAANPAAAPARLTRRGVLVLRSALALAVALGGALIFWVAGASHPASGAPAGAAPGTEVVVQPGDSLWSIATRVAPSADPRATVDRLIDVNHLRGAALTPGQVLHVS